MIPSRGVLTTLCGVGAVVALGACQASTNVSVGPKTIDRAIVERQAAAQLQQEVGAPKAPNLDCPADLNAKVGATVNCTLSSDDSSDEYAVHIVVTSIRGTEAVFNVRVADSPN